MFLKESQFCLSDFRGLRLDMEHQDKNFTDQSSIELSAIFL